MTDLVVTCFGRHLGSRLAAILSVQTADCRCGANKDEILYNKLEKLVITGLSAVVAALAPFAGLLGSCLSKDGLPRDLQSITYTSMYRGTGSSQSVVSPAGVMRWETCLRMKGGCTWGY